MILFFLVIVNFASINPLLNISARQFQARNKTNWV